MSLFSEWNKEYMSRDTLETDDGFISYQMDDGACYICDIFIKKEKRSSGLGAELVRSVEKIALQHNCKKIIGGVVSTVPEATARVRFALALGFSLQSSASGYIWLEKEIH